MPAEGREDRRRMGSPVREVPVVVVDRAHLRHPVERAAAPVRCGRAAGVRIAAGIRPRLVPELVRDLPGSLLVDPCSGEVAHREVPNCLAGDIRFAVDFLAARAAAGTAGRHLREVVRCLGHVGGVLVPVLVPNARAVEARVAVA